MNPVPEELKEEPKGLSSAEARRVLEERGPNELPSSKPLSVWKLGLRALGEPMLLLLVSCGVLYLAIGSARDGILLFCSAALVVFITIYQETKAERALEKLRELSSPRALVVRDGKTLRIPGRDVVPGDLIVLREGDRVPADAELFVYSHLRVDESLLTGESAPVLKTARDRQIRSGTLIVGGQGSAIVTATGSGTAMGRIGESLQPITQQRTALQEEIVEIVKRFGALGGGISLLVAILYGATRGDWAQGLLAGIAAAMALLPEEFPVVLTIFLALGAWRMSVRKVLTRRAAAIENLGAVTTLCVDKTGTLTLNQMTVRALAAPAGGIVEIGLSEQAGQDLPEVVHSVVEYGVLASHVDPYDPMEKAILATLNQKLAGTEHVHRDWKLVREYPLSPELLAMSCVWTGPTEGQCVIASKGAPEAIADLCHLGSAELQSILEQVREMASRGLRVLGVAQARFCGPGSIPEGLPANPHDFDFQFVGLIGLEDPLRPEAADAVGECHRAGIRVLMMTGDYPETARSIARQAGIEYPEEVITGSELASISDEALAKRLGHTRIFARVVPEQKLRIVRALKALGQVVAMTGDGVNDAPSLKQSDIGIAMGSRGTDVAREASDLVLLDDNFASIVAGVRTGRRIYDNILKAVSFIIAVHAPIAGMAVLPVAFGLPLVLLPAHIVFLELIIDPACSLVFETEREDEGIMRRAPRRMGGSLFSRWTVLHSLLQGIAVLVVVLGVFLFSVKQGRGADESRTLAFVTLVLSNLGLILVNRAGRRSLVQALTIRNRAFVFVSTGTLILLTLCLEVPALRGVFSFAPLSLRDLALSLGAALLATGGARWASRS